ncbi:MAG: M56 family metallopeptidase, partial [Clostridia bacterium]|nr:M56 family metallopeptidase [Clostridia bacterium]
MADVFLKLCNVSIGASWMVLVILLLRILLKKAPRWTHCLMWGLVGLRLLMPAPLTSLFSLVPADPLPDNFLMTPSPTIDSSVPLINQWINPILSEHFAPNPGDSVNPMQVIFAVAGQVWLLGMVVMLGCCLWSYLRLHRQVAPSLQLHGRVYACDAIASPFILGMLRPRIYVPSALPDDAMTHVLRHEEAHLKRRDHWWKPLGYLLLAVHWFNPVLWAAYVLLCRDIEQACDEKVMAQMNDADKKGYAEALLLCSVRSARIAGCPLAFGETSVKERICSVLSYRKPTVWILILALIVCIAAAVLLLPSAALHSSIADPELKSWLPQTLLDVYENEHTGDAFPCADYEVLGVKRDGAQTTVYMRVLYQEYTPKMSVQSGFCTPAVLTVRSENGQYIMEEYWTPGDGPHYKTDICAKFPVTLWYKAMV